MRLALVPCLLLAGCASAQPRTSPPPPTPTTAPSPAAHSTPAPKSKLVVLLVVDQLPAWTFARHATSFKGGFARLIREGVYYKTAMYPYAATITAIGHSALSTGAEPRRSGIVGNSWWDYASERWLDATADATHLTVPPLEKDDGASPHYRVVEAVGAGKNVLSMSTKERAAILMAPSTKGALAVWYEPQHTSFVTSTAYTDARPAWLETLAREHPIAPRLDYVWTPLDETPKRALVGDDSPGELGHFGFGAVFPHKLADGKVPEAINSTPLASELLAEAVIAGLDAVHPDLLNVSFSTHDYAAHAWGQESWEATDVLIRLDATIGKLLDAFDARYGADGWSLVLSSDHGGPRMPELTHGLRIDVADLRKAISSAIGDAKWLAAMDERRVYLSNAARKLPADARSKILDGIVETLRKTKGIGFAYRTDQFAKNADCTNLPSATETLVCRSIFEERTGDVYYGPSERSIVAKKPYESILHGTPYDYDRQVPIVVREPGRAAKLVEDDHPSPLRVAPTVARFLNVAPPPAAREPSL